MYKALSQLQGCETPVRRGWLSLFSASSGSSWLALTKADEASLALRHAGTLNHADWYPRPSHPARRRLSMRACETTSVFQQVHELPSAVSVTGIARLAPRASVKAGNARLGIGYIGTDTRMNLQLCHYVRCCLFIPHDGTDKRLRDGGKIQCAVKRATAELWRFRSGRKSPHASATDAGRRSRHGGKVPC
jgi:hypothetical protein